MAVWSYPHPHDYGLVIIESDAQPVIHNIADDLVTKVSDKAVYLIELYRSDAFDKTRYFEQKVFQNKADAEKQAAVYERSYRVDEDCEWHAHVVPAPLM